MAYLALPQENKQICGGFLVRKDFVMSAAHCYRNGLQVRLGVHNVVHPEASWQISDVKAQHFNNYDPDTHQNDIMLLQLKTPATLNKEVQLIPLPEEDQAVPEGTTCNVAGWGFNSSDQTSPKTSAVLMEVNVTVCSNQDCAAYLDVSPVPDSVLCAGLPAEGKDSSEYDSGGPLVCDGVAVGIVSYGRERSPPGMYTRISKFLPWIRGILKGPE